MKKRMKLIGLLFLVTAGLAWGSRRTWRLRRRARDLEAFGRLLTFLAGHIRYTAAPVQKILQTAADSGEFAEFSFLNEAAACAPEAFPGVWEHLVRRHGAIDGLTDTDIRLFTEWGGQIGRMDRESQLDALHLYGERVDEAWREARREATEKGRMYRSLGLAGGVAAALLLL